MDIISEVMINVPTLSTNPILIEQIRTVEFCHVSIHSCANSPVILNTISRMDLKGVQNSTRMWKIERGAVLENRNDHWKLLETEVAKFKNSAKLNFSKN